MENELRKKLMHELKLAVPEIGKDIIYKKCVDKYIRVMLQAISQAIVTNYKDVSLKAGEFALAHDKLNNGVGRIRIGDKQEYIVQVMKRNSSTSLLEYIRDGFNYGSSSMLSLVKLNPIYRDLIMRELLNLTIEKNQELIDESETNFNFTINVDPASLASYINKTSESITTSKNGSAYDEKLIRNLIAARQIQILIHEADETNSKPYLKEYWHMADSGRIFGHGYSLQKMPRDVRHAALGICHKYDFKASAFAIMSGLAHLINPELKIGETLDYIKNRQIVRKRIAKELNVSEELIKSIFNSLGFGAELIDNQFHAIRKELAKYARKQQNLTGERLEQDIYNNLGADEYNLLINNVTFSQIYKELQLINSTIINYCKDNELVINGRTYCDINPNNNKKRNDKQKLAWIYQGLESMAMQQFNDFAIEVQEIESLLTTHDCLYFKQRLTAESIKDINYHLNKTFQYLRFEHEEIYPIVEDEFFNARYSEQDMDSQRHKEFIINEQRRAESYVNKFALVKEEFIKEKSHHAEYIDNILQERKNKLDEKMYEEMELEWQMSCSTFNYDN